MKTVPIILLTLTAAAALSFATPGFANLVTNPGFETGDFTGWTQFDDTGFSGVDGNPHAGTFAAFFGPVGDTGGIFQSLATAPGAMYTLSFWLSNDGGPGNSFSASWNGVVIPGSILTDAGAFGYTQFTFTGLLATGAATDLRFTFRNDPSFWFLDDVDVEAQATPEAFSTVWLVLPFIGIVLFRRLRSA
jgi:hypothetical protein